MTDEAISRDAADILASLQGDGEAYGRLVRRYQDDVAGWLWRFTSDPMTLEELVQETFVQAYVSLRRLHRHGAFGGWLRKIATRVGYRHWRARKGRDVSLPDRDVPAEAPDPSIRQDRQWVVDDVLGRLPPRDRLVVQLRYLDELSVAQVAELTGWSAAMVKVQSFRARKRLRGLLERMGRSENE